MISSGRMPSSPQTWNIRTKEKRFQNLEAASLCEKNYSKIDKRKIIWYNELTWQNDPQNRKE